MKKVSVAILTEHRARNFGSCLQVYALQETLKSMGVDATIVDYRPQAIEDSFGIFIKDLYNESKSNIINLISFYIKTIVFFPKRYMREKKFEEFRNNYYHLTKNVYTDDNINDNNLCFDIYFYGSDQIWNPKITKGLCDAYFGVPFDRDAIHASYAASIGLSHLNNEEANFREKLKFLDYISVREETAKELIQNLTDKDVKVVLDPTLIVNRNIWFDMVKNVKIKEKYILVYSLKVDTSLIEYVKKLSAEKNLKVVFFDLKKRYGKNCISDFSADPQDFISYVKHADYIVTNSFHGTVFSVLFEKKFICVPMEGTSSRMINLLENLKLTDRLYSDNCNIDEEINYKTVNNNLLSLKKESIDFLERVINSYEQN